MQMMIEFAYSMFKSQLLIIVFIFIRGVSFGSDNPVSDTAKSGTHIMFDLGVGAGEISNAPSRLFRIGFSAIVNDWGGGMRFLSLSGKTGIDNGWFGPPRESFTEKAVLAYHRLPAFKNHEILLGAGYGVMDGSVLTDDQYSTTDLEHFSGFAFEAALGNHSRGVGYRATASGNINGVKNYFGVLFSLIFILR